MGKRGRPRKTFICSVEGCDRVHFGRGFCRPHYCRHKRNGDAGSEKIGKPRGNDIQEKKLTITNERIRILKTKLKSLIDDI